MNFLVLFSMMPAKCKHCLRGSHSWVTFCFQWTAQLYPERKIGIKYENKRGRTLVLDRPLAGYVTLGSLEHPWWWKWCWCPRVDIERNTCDHAFALRNLSPLPPIMKYSGPPDGLCGPGHTLPSILQSQSKSSIIYRTLGCQPITPSARESVCVPFTHTLTPALAPTRNRAMLIPWALPLTPAPISQSL